MLLWYYMSLSTLVRQLQETGSLPYHLHRISAAPPNAVANKTPAIEQDKK